MRYSHFHIGEEEVPEVRVFEVSGKILGWRYALDAWVKRW